jgi:hypothetical protein
VNHAPQGHLNRIELRHYTGIFLLSLATLLLELSLTRVLFLATASAYQPSCIVYVGKERPKVLIIGSGAGREILEALYFGASSITAVEVNPIINDIVARRMKERLGGSLNVLRSSWSLTKVAVLFAVPRNGTTRSS